MEIEIELGGIELEIKGLRGFATMIAISLVAAALVRELMRAPADRTWHGRVLGFVPYDFRPPKVDRILNELWNPQSESLLAPHAFGVGWGINLGAVAKRLGLVA